jgi:anti-sigma regulatory factor (Ser/Thr protein kinase)
MSAGDTLIISNHHAEVERVCSWIAELAKSAGVPHSVCFKLDLCVAEAVTNVIDYGYEDQGKHEISLRCAITEKRIELVMEDNGKPFNPLKAPEPKHPTSLKEADIGGLGIPLLRAYTKECYYTRDADKNKLTMVLAIESAPEQTNQR